MHTRVGGGGGGQSEAVEGEAMKEVQKSRPFSSLEGRGWEGRPITAHWLRGLACNYILPIESGKARVLMH